MNCTKCGAQLEAGMTNCPLCGAPVEDAVEMPAVEPAEAPVTEPVETPAETVEAPVEETAEPETAEPETEEPAAAPEEPTVGDEAPSVEGQEPAAVTEETPVEAPKKQTGRVALFAAIAVLAVAVLIFAVTSLGKGSGDAKEPAENPGTTTEESANTNAALNTTDDNDPTAMNNLDADGNYVEHTYTVDKESMTAEDAETVVATCGSGELTNGELSFYYWQQYYNFMNTYGSYATMMGLDTTKPLSEQMYDDSHSWEDFFLQAAMRAYWQTEAINAAAAEDGYTLDAETEEYLASLTDSMTSEAEANDYASVDAYIQDAYGPYVTMDSYTAFAREMMTASGYLSTVFDGISITDDDISAYFDENAATYEAQGISKDDPNMVNVRHILIMPQADEDAETDESGNPVLTDENWADAKAKADEIYAQWQAGEATEDSFAALATEHSEDPGSQANGGLYEEVYPGYMVTEFNDWCFDEARQVGDTEIVKTPYGYHIMYFSGVCDHPYWYKVAQQDCLSSRQQELMQEMVDAAALTVDYSKVKLTETGLL